MKADYEHVVAVMIAEQLGISASRVSVKTDRPNSVVLVSWQTSALLRGEQRSALIEKAQALLPDALRIRIR
jgi:hypothetical protein